MRNKKSPAAVATADGAQGIAVSKNTAIIAQPRGNANSPVITGIRRGPGGKADWLVSIKGVCSDEGMRNRILRRYSRFCKSIEWRFKFSFDPMPQADWSAIVEAAIAAEGGAS